MQNCACNVNRGCNGNVVRNGGARAGRTHERIRFTEYTLNNRACARATSHEGNRRPSADEERRKTKSKTRFFVCFFSTPRTKSMSRIGRENIRKAMARVGSTGGELIPARWRTRASEGESAITREHESEEARVRQGASDLMGAKRDNR